MLYLRSLLLVLPLSMLACDGADHPSFADAALFDAPARGETRRPTADGGRRRADLGLPPDAGVVDSSARPDVGGPARMSSQPDAGLDPDGARGGGASCQTLATDYQVALQQAKACNPILPTPSCQLVVDDALDCPCDTTVNAANTAAVAKLKQLASQWTQSGCGPGANCGGGSCTPPSKGNCQSAGPGNQGGCLD